jgi:hypothetical protein
VLPLDEYQKDHSTLNFQVNTTTWLDESTTAAFADKTPDIDSLSVHSALEVKNPHSKNIID